MITKAQLKEQIDKFPESEFSIEALIERLLFINKLENRISASSRGETVPDEEMEKMFQKWSKSNG